MCIRDSANGFNWIIVSALADGAGNDRAMTQEKYELRGFLVDAVPGARDGVNIQNVYSILCRAYKRTMTSYADADATSTVGVISPDIDLDQGYWKIRVGNPPVDVDLLAGWKAALGI